MKKKRKVKLGPTPRIVCFGSCYVHPALLLGHPTNSEVDKMPFCENHFRKNLLPESFRKSLFPETFRKDLLPKEEFVIPEVLRNSFRKNVIRNVSGRSFFRKISFYFRKKGLLKFFFLNYFFVII